MALAVIGFLLAMLAPRLSGVAMEASETVGQTNMARLAAYLTNNLQHNGRYPAGMINIVSVGTSGEYYKPMVSDGDPEEPEVLAASMDERHRFHVHYLNGAEAAELRSLGVVRVFSYNSPYDRNPALGNHAPHMQQVDAGVAVLMTGGGVDSGGSFVVDSAHEISRAHPDQMFRIVLGLGPECELVTNGMVHNVPLCLETSLGPVNYGWKFYSLLLPRLQATAQRLVADNPLGSGELTAYGVVRVADSTALASARKRLVDVYSRQHHSFFEVMDARGNTRPGPDMMGWGLDFNTNGAIE